MVDSKVNHLRSILKAISYRVFASMGSAVIVFILLSLELMPRIEITKKVYLSLGVALCEAIVKILLYYIHERIWSFIKIGKKDHPLSSLKINKPLQQEDMAEVKQKLKNMGYISED